MGETRRRFPADSGLTKGSGPKRRPIFSTDATRPAEFLQRVTLDLTGAPERATMPREKGLVCLVTGGCGFLGKHLVRLLAERSEELKEIRVLDMVLDRELEALSTASLRVSLMQGDITSPGDMARAIQGADLVFHLASVIDFLGLIPESQILSINIQGTQTVIDACVQHDVPTLVYTSSMEAVGPNSKGQPFHRGDEDTVYEFAPASVYGRSKFQAEGLIRGANGMKTASGKTLFTLALRPLGIYGEGVFLLRNLAERASLCRGRLFRLSSADARMGCAYVGNVVWMHLLAARALREKPGLVGGQVYYCYDDSPDRSFLDFNMEFLASCGTLDLTGAPERATMPREKGLVCLVTGGCGFLGKHLVRLLAERSEELKEIRVLDMVLDRELEALSTASLRVSLMQGDITSPGDMARAIQGADLIFHLASVIDFLGLIPESQILSINIQGTQTVIDACVQHDVPTLVYTSSMEAVGPNSKGQPFHRGDEDTVYEFAPASVYARSKFQAEGLIRGANGMKVRARGSAGSSPLNLHCYNGP
ncbi:3 beta-hydroxysteroid dehydrogenase type 7-like [Mobula birostris]|uniref:3 beta-hydroxysteroid dehydrogenase type 7-like n=1 Tax=Mobula birostris TaxID=1983395 RepID=UPI003B28BD87